MLEHGTLPFEGSEEIAGIVAGLIAKHGVTTFVETGTQHAATTFWATQHGGLRVITVEIDPVTYEEACIKLRGSGAITLLGNSAERLSELEFKPGESVLFYLDAHSVKGTPIVAELGAISKLVGQFGIVPIIAIHDFQVPDRPELGFDRYEDGTVLNMALIEGVFSSFGACVVRYNGTPDGAARGFCYITP